MKTKGVTLHLGTSYDEEFKEKQEYDHVIQCAGYTFKTDFMKKNENFVDCLSDKGQIYVNDHLQVTNKNPQTKHHNKSVVVNQNDSVNTEDLDHPLHEEKVYANIFSLGDVCLTSVNEEKTIYPLKVCAEICAQNIIKME